MKKTLSIFMATALCVFIGGCDDTPGKINLKDATIVITTGFEDPAEIVIKMHSATKGAVICPVWPESKTKCTVKGGKINISFKCRERLANGGEALCYFDGQIMGSKVEGYLVEESPWRGRARLISNQPAIITLP